MALGSGAAGMHQKLRSLAARTFTETGSLARTQAIFARIRALCVDMGTECALPDACGLELTDILPPWQTAAAAHLQPDVDDEGDPPTPTVATGRMPSQEPSSQQGPFTYSTTWPETWTPLWNGGMTGFLGRRHYRIF